MIPPRHPCPYCGSSRFALIEQGTIEVLSDAKVGFGNVLHPVISLLVCEGCGHTAWFMVDHPKMLRGVKHTTLVARPGG